jgi:hypothetical protein
VAGVRRRLRGRHIALVLAIVVVVLITAGVISLTVYHEQTKIDRSTPTVAVAQLVDAMFTARDEAGVARFSCPESRLGPLRDLAATINQQEKSYNTHIVVSVEYMQLMGQSTVETKLSLAGMGWNTIQSWNFDTVDHDGWRVCAARKTG